jgi:hypothetical protein
MGTEMKGTIFKKELVIGIILLFLITSIAPGISGSNNENDQHINITPASCTPTEKTTTLTFYVFGKTTIEKHEMQISSADATQISEMFEELKREMTTYPSNEKTQRLQQEFCTLLQEKGVIPQEMSKEELVSLLQPPVIPQTHRQWNIAPFQNKASEWLCTYVSFGSGASFPIIILPRFIPFILTPIPRVFLRWSAKDGVTSCGGLASGTGFIAVGEQKGIALGFWGIGFTFSLPPLMNTYGMAGYALYATVTADYIEHYPPNSPPEITGADPIDGEENVTVSLSELRFRIEDADGDLMNYVVTTEPDIGSGSGSLKSDGVYTIPVSDLQSYTEYVWHIQVDDGKDTVEQTQWFKTEPIEPIVSNPSPADSEREVPIALPSLHFTLKDFQGDAMDYTMETSPDIGSGSGAGVHDGTYTVPVSDLAYGSAYRWYVNVTDGSHWARKMFSFETGYPAQFNPFDFGWHYRKQIIIDHTKVADDLTNFPVFLNTIDANLILKTQSDGGDILFMTAAGVASKLYHEIDMFDQPSGALVAWVKIPLLSSSTDTVVYMYYGNPSCLNIGYREKVWKDTFNAVYHLSEMPTGPVQDSTGYKNNGVAKGAMTSSDLVTGKLGTCYEFDGSDDCISFKDFTRSLDQGACSAWVQTTGNGEMMVWGEGATSWVKPYLALGKGTGGQLLYSRDIYGTDSNFQGRTEVGLDDGNWHYIVWLSQGSEDGNRFYVDGEEVSMTWQDGQNPDGLWFDDQDTDTTSVGCLDRSSARDSPWDGLLDEIRIADTPLDSSWIETEYQNQWDPAGFLFIGPEEPGP